MSSIIRKTIGLSLLFLLISCAGQSGTEHKPSVPGILKVGFDIDDTVLFSRDNFLKAPKDGEDPDQVDFGWINQHDSLYSVTIEPIAELIGFLRAHGHEVYFITARPGTNGAGVGRHLTRELGFPVVLGENLFFSAKEKNLETGFRYTTKHEIISALGLHIYYGDSDTDMIAASIAGVRAVRVVRDDRSVEAYSRNYFGDTRSSGGAKAPFSETDYVKFLSLGVGPFGESIYPIYVRNAGEGAGPTGE